MLLLSSIASLQTASVSRVPVLRGLLLIMIVGTGVMSYGAYAQVAFPEGDHAQRRHDGDSRALLYGLEAPSSNIDATLRNLGADDEAGGVGEPVEWEEVRYEGRPHIKVTTPRAIYFYDNGGGGFSRIIDSEGRDWVGWHPEPEEYPPGAAGFFRGVPNYQDGPGHPGFDVCSSRVDSASSDRVVIRSSCREGTWTFTWTIHPRYAENHIVSTPEKIWFLYEGPIAGRYAPRDQYWGTDEGGPYIAAPNWVAGEREYGSWRWAYFGDAQVDRVFFLAMKGQYTEKSIFGYLGAVDSTDAPQRAMNASDGMIVFGFGRKSYPDKHIVGDGKTFYLGFVEHRVTDSTSHDAVARRIEEVIGEEEN